MANRLADGKLEKILSRYGAEGLSLRAISERLWDDHRIEVSHSTVASWQSLLARTDSEPAA